MNGYLRYNGYRNKGLFNYRVDFGHHRGVIFPARGIQGVDTLAGNGGLKGSRTCFTCGCEFETVQKFPTEAV